MIFQRLRSQGGDLVSAVRGLDTPDAITSAPHGSSDSYAYMNGNAGRASASSCAQRYRSYDPVSGTFLGRDGARHPCP